MGSSYPGRGAVRLPALGPCALVDFLLQPETVIMLAIRSANVFLRAFMCFFGVAHARPGAGVDGVLVDRGAPRSSQQGRRDGGSMDLDSVPTPPGVDEVKFSLVPGISTGMVDPSMRTFLQR